MQWRLDSLQNSIQASLSESWEGPYEVLERLSTVNDRVRQVDARGKG